ncbi:wax ester/triacylglycerol synthase family O-acyltransferase [Mycobacterium sp. OTB74]|uniref:wax ester/triacylglycerol synthase family O-acyltransferase n=1 Tax=Mycobacterium sp. OTB74 TaxID=1853452 RepID=UPI002473861C|nr:wax ester/triacylglycerol synthase family O-acyltransferase [Mycobacterium sp. OTB74]MDH6246463.1 diacylglycerol O-acyltransferase [Mycobacterium sp. OTB74]
MRRLTALDAQFFAGESGNACSHYMGLAIYDTSGEAKITATQMRRLISERIDHPGLLPLRWKLTTVPLGLDHPVFVETDPDLGYHVTESTLPAPVDEATLATEVGAVLSKKLDRSKPLWKVQVFHGLSGRTAVGITIHHAAADGVAAAEIFAALHEDPDEAASGRPLRRRPNSEPSRVGLAIRGLASLPLRPVRVARSLPNTLANFDLHPIARSLPGVHEMSSAVRGDWGSQRLDAPRTPFNVRLCGERTVAFGKVSLADAKAAKRLFGSTVNDVVVAVCGGALRRRLIAQRELPDEPLVAYCPVSARSSASNDRFGNELASMVVPLPTHLPTLDERIEFAHDTLVHAKRRKEAAGPTFMRDANEPIPAPMFGLVAGGLMNLASSRWVRPPANVLVSNVPGPPGALECGGAPLLGWYPISLILEALPLNMTVVSYNGSLDVGIVGDAKGLPDAWALLDDFHSEMAELAKRVRT